MAGGTRSRVSGATQIVVATAVGGGSGYVLTIVVAARLGTAEYSRFGIFWSLLFFAVSVLGGVQQEFARAVSPARGDAAPGVRAVILICGAVVALVAGGSSPAWTPLIADDGWALVVPITVGLLGYLVTATFAGVLYGLRWWTMVAAMVAADGVIRLVLTVSVVSIAPSTGVLAWCVTAPFVVVPLLVWVVARRRVVGGFRLDASPRSILGHIGSTVAGSAAMGVMISGYSAVIALTSPTASATALGAVVFALNLARAPLVIVVLALQSFLVVQFRDSSSWRSQLVVIVVAIVIVAGLLSGAAWVTGPTVLGLFGRDFVLAPGLLAAIVGSGGLVGALCATGAAAVARSLHTAFVAGWSLAAVATIALLAAPLDFETRIALSLVSPVIGLAAHAVALVRSTQSSPPSGERSSSS